MTVRVYVPYSDPTPTLNLASEIAPAPFSVQAIVTTFRNTPEIPVAVILHCVSVPAPVMVCPAVMVTVVPARAPVGGEPVVGESVKVAAWATGVNTDETEMNTAEVSSSSRVMELTVRVANSMHNGRISQAFII